MPTVTLVRPGVLPSALQQRPANSTELNPEERLNADLKHAYLYQGSGTHEGQAESRSNRTHADVGNITGACQKHFQDSRVKCAACITDTKWPDQ